MWRLSVLRSISLCRVAFVLNNNLLFAKYSGSSFRFLLVFFKSILNIGCSGVNPRGKGQRADGGDEQIKYETFEHIKDTYFE